MLELFLSFLCGIIALVTASPNRAGATPVPVRPDRATHARLRAAYGELPLSFEANEGQTDPGVKFLARAPGYTLFFMADGAVLAVRQRENESTGKVQHSTFSTHAPAVLRMMPVGADSAPKVTGLEELPGKSNYFVGNDPRRWHSNIPTYAKIRYENVYPGVDLVYYGNPAKAGQLEYDFVVRPGADPKAIRLNIGTRDEKLETHESKIASPLQIDRNGDLLIETHGGEAHFRKPVAYQPDSDAGFRTPDFASRPPGMGDSPIENRKFVDARFVLRAANRQSKIQNTKYEVGFEVSAYDTRKPLILDPVLSYSTYLGGSGGDIALGIAIDASGNAYVTGSTASTNFPTASPAQTVIGGLMDVFVAKLNPAGTALVYSTYLGGNDADKGTGIAVDSSGNAYVTGTTASNNFPTKSAFQTNYGGNGDAFVAELNPVGSALVFSSYLGGSGADFGQGVAVDSSGNVYVTGTTESPNFPTMGPFQPSNGGASDAFVTKIKASGSALAYSTYLGGSAADSGQGIAVNAAGNAYVTGFTFSTNFPTMSAFRPSNNGSADAFVAELNSAGSALVFSTYLGGGGLDRAFGIALDTFGNVYITGDTQSNDFPTTGNGFRTVDSGNGEAFVSKFSPTGSSLIYSTFLGGSDVDQGTAIAVDAAANAYVTGFTRSNDFPTANALQATFGGGSCGVSVCSDAFVSRLDSSGSSLVYSTYLGGSGADFGQAIAVDPSGRAFVAGGTASPDFTVNAGALQAAFGGTGASGSAYVAEIDPADAPGLAISPQTIDFGNQAVNTTSTTKTVTLTDAGTAPLDITSIVSSGPFAQKNNCVGTVPAGGGKCTVSVTFTPTTMAAATGQITINDSASGSPHQISLTGTGVSPAPAVSVSPASLTFPGQTFGTSSASQTLTLTNSGSAALSITKIAAGSEFAETDNCGSSLDPAASCAINVIFTPSGTGSRTGSLTVTDNASGSPHLVKLTGTGVAVFSLSSTSPSTTILIGSMSTTFTVSASVPSGFADSITLTCSAGAATCSFDPSSIKAGQNSTVTVNGLTATTANPLNFTVTGTDGAQSASLPLTILFSAFSVSASPALNSTTAGGSAVYAVTVTPSNGFSQSVTLSCIGLPQGASCSFSPSSVTPTNSGPASASLKLSTTAHSVSGPRRGPFVTFPPGMTRTRTPWLVSFLALALLGGLIARFGAPHAGTESWKRARLSALTLGTALAALALWTSCQSYGSSPIGTPTGTPGGTFTIIITGTLGSNSAVTRATTVNLSVG